MNTRGIRNWLERGAEARNSPFLSPYHPTARLSVSQSTQSQPTTPKTPSGNSFPCRDCTQLWSNTSPIHPRKKKKKRRSRSSISPSTKGLDEEQWRFGFGPTHGNRCVKSKRVVAVGNGSNGGHESRSSRASLLSYSFLTFVPPPARLAWSHVRSSVVRHACVDGPPLRSHNHQTGARALPT